MLSIDNVDQYVDQCCPLINFPEARNYTDQVIGCEERLSPGFKDRKDRLRRATKGLQEGRKDLDPEEECLQHK